MSKERRTVTLDPKTDEYLSQEEVNASKLVNKLVRDYTGAGGNSRAMLELREQQLESELSELESRTETKRDELERVREQLGAHEDQRETILDEARNTLRDTQLEPGNPAVQTWADKADMSVEEFLDVLLDEGGGGT